MPPRRTASKTTNTKTASGKPTAADKKKLIDIIESIHYLDENKALRLLDKLAEKETIKYSPSNQGEYVNNKPLFLVNTLVTSKPTILNASVLSQACLYGMHNVVKKIIEMGGDVQHIAQDVVELTTLSYDPTESAANKIDLRGANMLHICSLKLMVVDTIRGILDDEETREHTDRLYKTSSIDYLECVNLITSRLRSIKDSSSEFNITNGRWDNKAAKRTTSRTVTYLTIKSTPSGYLNSDYGFKRTDPRIPNPLYVMGFFDDMITISVNNFSAETNTTPLYTLLFSNPLLFSDIMASVVEDGTGLTELYEKKQELVTNIMSRLVQSQGTIDGKDSDSNLQTYQNIKNAINSRLGDDDPFRLVEHSEGGPIIGAIGSQTRTIQNPDGSIIHFYNTLQTNMDAQTRGRPSKPAKSRVGSTRYVPPPQSPPPDDSGAAVGRPTGTDSLMQRKKTQRNKRLTRNNNQPSPGARPPRGRNTRGKKPVGKRTGSKTSRKQRRSRTPRTA